MQRVDSSGKSAARRLFHRRSPWLRCAVPPIASLMLTLGAVICMCSPLQSHFTLALTLTLTSNSHERPRCIRSQRQRSSGVHCHAAMDQQHGHTQR